MAEPQGQPASEDKPTEPSPCTKVCRLFDSQGRTMPFCLGCGRTRNEIASWIGLPDAERRLVKQLAKDRLDALATLSTTTTN